MSAIVCALLFLSPASSQTDYLMLRENVITIGCGHIPKDEVKRNIDTLLSLADAVQMDNAFLLYRDLGLNYYRMWGLESDSVQLSYAIHAFNTSIALQPSWNTNYMDVAICCYFLQDCECILEQLEKYKQHTKPRLRDKVQLQEFEKFCVAAKE